MRVLTVNPGSTSLKVALVVDGEAVESETVDAHAAVADLAERWEPVDAAGVRFVHGGRRHLEPVRLAERVLADLDEVADLAPLHDPPAAAAARALLDADPDRPVVACFDTTYHADLPAAAATYALPREWNRRWGLRRYGFHGLSHAYAARRAAEHAGRSGSSDGLRVVSCHLGGGASLCASVGGRSVDTTMGFTPMDGLVMATRSGSVDPGLLLWLLRNGVGAEELEETLDRRSGLAGLSGVSGDLREVLAAAEDGDADAALARDVYLHRLAREAGAMVASAGGLDVLVLTGGVGEHSDWVREQLVARLAHLGSFEVLVVEAREELMIDEAVRAVLDEARGPASAG